MVDIDREVLGYLWVEDATVNLLANAHIRNDYYLGDMYAASGAVVNIYGGQIDNLLMISTMYNGLPDPVVTVHGSDFAVNGMPVEPGTSELFLLGEMLSGVYEDGVPFAFLVECFREGDVMMMLRLNWVNAAPAPLPDIETQDVDFGEVLVGGFAMRTASIVNAGSADLMVESVTLEDATTQFFLSDAMLPAVLEPNAVLEIGLVYVPAAAQAASGVLRVVSDDPDEQVTEIALLGMGALEVTPLDRMDETLAFFDQAVTDGTIAGTGWGWVSQYRLEAMGHLLRTARCLVERDCYAGAAGVLRVADLKTDGLTRPYDFVEGAAVGELNRQINELVEMLEMQ